MQRLLIRITILISILGAIAAGAKITGLDKEIIKKLTKEEIKEQPKKEAEFEKATLVDLKTITMTVFLNKNKRTNFTISLRLDVPPDKEEDVRKKLPRIRDIFVKELYVFMPKVLKDKKVINLKAVKQILLQAGYIALGKDNLNDILIRSAYQE